MSALMTSGGAKPPYAFVTWEVPNGTYPGTLSSGAWRTTTLNTIVEDDNSIITLGSNQITLVDPGTYKVIGNQNVHRCNAYTRQIYDHTNGATLIKGNNGYAASGGGVFDYGSCIGEFTTLTSIAFSMQVYCHTSRSSDGFGSVTAYNDGNEVFAQVHIWKVA